MNAWLKELDELLRGRKTTPQLLAAGVDHLPVQSYVAICLILGGIYGICMGFYGIFSRPDPSYLQVFASALKVPALFVLSLIVTFPSLYVFSALLGTRLDPLQCLKVTVAATTINLAVLASFATITLFFTLTTTSYLFMKLLNVLFFAIAGLMGVAFLTKAMRRLLGQPEAESKTEDAGSASETSEEATPEPESTDASSETVDETIPVSKSAGDADNGTALGVIRVWVVLYGFVGAQMGWILRPFIGSPDLPFEWFRRREANFFIDVIRSLVELLGG